tara:strand:- start:12767 stop:13759 length:993 start_codon:yes stop_codon:yes gene_type:complete
MKILITGCFGFIGYNFLNYLYETYSQEIKILGIDSLEFPTSKLNSKMFSNKNFEFFNLDINDINKTEIKGVDVVINFAAESHVDNSISNPVSFIESNVNGVGNLLFWAMKNKIKKVIHISTDEVYGSLKTGFPNEEFNFNPSSPYSATKAGAEYLCKSFSNTFDQNIITIRPSNNYGIYQQPEKLIPYSITSLLNGKNVEVYGNGSNIRHWLHVQDTCRAIFKIMEKSSNNETYNIGSGVYLDNLSVVKKLLNILQFDESRIDFVEDRLGHDFRYAVDFTKLQNLGWEPKKDFDLELENIVFWYKKNKQWWDSSYKEIIENRKRRNKLID